MWEPGQQPGLGMDSLQDAVRPERRGCCPALCKLVPVGFRAEAWRLFVLSGPLVRRWHAGRGGWGPAAPGMTWVCQGLPSTLPQKLPRQATFILHQGLPPRAGDSGRLSLDGAGGRGGAWPRSAGTPSPPSEAHGQVGVRGLTVTSESQRRRNHSLP